MKKRILFVEEGLGMGGAEKSLLTILSLIDYSKYDVDLFLFKHTGSFMSLLPKEVNLLYKDNNYVTFNSNRKMSPLRFLKNLDIKRSINSFMYLINSAFHKLVLKKEYIGWEYIKHIFSPLEEEYDVAVSFLEKKTFYFNVDKVKAKKRIGFIHIDYSKIQYKYTLDKKYFSYFTNIATVSHHCMEVLKDIFPEYKDKFLVIKNMLCTEIIEKMAQEEVDFDEKYINILTVGRLTYQKGIDNAILICKELVNEGYKIRWYVAGKGEDRDKLNELIKENNLENNFILLGPQLNPYKYIKACDIYVQPSRYEGYGITLAEAKALKKSIVASNIPEFQEQIINEINGLLGNNNKEIESLIIKLVEDKNLSNRIQDNLLRDKTTNNNKELSKLYEVIEV